MAGQAAVIGAGPMGLWMAKHLANRGYRVAVYDKDFKKARRAARVLKARHVEDLDAAIEMSELAVLAVGTENAGPLLQSFLKKFDGKIFVDISSVKTPLMRFLPKKTPDSTVVLTHPLFGPGTTTLKDKTVVVTPVYRRRVETSLAKHLFNPCRVVSMNPRQHDQAMAYMMAAMRVATFAVLELWRRHGVPVFTTSQKAFMTAASTMLADSFRITYQVVSQNPYSEKVLDELVKILESHRGKVKTMPAQTHRRLEKWLRPGKLYREAYRIVEKAL